MKLKCKGDNAGFMSMIVMVGLIAAQLYSMCDFGYPYNTILCNPGA